MYQQSHNPNMTSTIITTEQIAFLIPLSPPLPATKQLRLFLCGALSGIISRTITAPLDRVKIILQVSSSKNEKKTVTQVVDEIWKTEGINGFFRGNITNCIRVAPHNAIRFFVFENMKRFLLPVGAKQLPTGRKLLCGAIAGSCAVVAVHPLDVARARIASQRGSATPKYKSTFNCLKTVYKEEGLKGLYAGLPVAVSVYNCPTFHHHILFFNHLLYATIFSLKYIKLKRFLNIYFYFKLNRIKIA